MERDERTAVIEALIAELDLVDTTAWKIGPQVGNRGCSLLGYSFVYRELTQEERKVRNVRSGYMILYLKPDIEATGRALGG